MFAADWTRRGAIGAGTAALLTGAPRPRPDAQRGMRLIRARARDYGISPDRVGAMDFSAGGMSAAIWRRGSRPAPMIRSTPPTG